LLRTLTVTSARPAQAANVLMRRREFLTGLPAAGLLAACGGPPTPTLPPLTVTATGHGLGHRLPVAAGTGFPAPDRTQHTAVLIAGGGIGGLGAAWRLRRAGCEDFLLCELEAEPGGNSRSARNAVSDYPLAAHYLPLPPHEAVAVRELLRELGALKGSGDRLADYDETLLTAAPQERLYVDGWWQDGLWPTHRVSAADRVQYARFQAFTATLRRQRDAAGRRPFALPLERSSQAAEWRALDAIGFRDWLLREGYTAPGLHWLANYATRDDYGTDYAQTSAWAGLHYFSCRDDGDTEGHVLTTPGGNAWLAQGLARGIGDRLLAPAIVFRIEQGRQSFACDVFLAAENRSVRIHARQLVWAGPLFPVPHVFVNPAPALAALARDTAHAPWVVVNLTLAAPPRPGAGVPLAWDNVFRDSDSLGYVVATHQAPRYAPGPTVLTWYRALHEPGVAPSRQRRVLLDDPGRWATAALDDIARAHPEVRELATHIHVHANGHAMARPQPGTVWHPARAALRRGDGGLAVAHGDLSGLSLFEEALHCGTRAAEQTLRRLGLPVGRALG
jgi:phytoene dehydrogenase-like protein